MKAGTLGLMILLALSAQTMFGLTSAQINKNNKIIDEILAMNPSRVDTAKAKELTDLKDVMKKAKKLSREKEVLIDDLLVKRRASGATLQELADIRAGRTVSAAAPSSCSGELSACQEDLKEETDKVDVRETRIETMRQEIVRLETEIQAKADALALYATTELELKGAIKYAADALANGKVHGTAGTMYPAVMDYLYSIEDPAKKQAVDAIRQ